MGIFEFAGEKQPIEITITGWEYGEIALAAPRPFFA